LCALRPGKIIIVSLNYNLVETHEPEELHQNLDTLETLLQSASYDVILRMFDVTATYYREKPCFDICN